MCVFFCFKQKTAYEMRISDWSSDVCSSDLQDLVEQCLKSPGMNCVFGCQVAGHRFLRKHQRCTSFLWSARLDGVRCPRHEEECFIVGLSEKISQFSSVNVAAAIADQSHLPVLDRRILTAQLEAHCNRMTVV